MAWGSAPVHTVRKSLLKFTLDVFHQVFLQSSVYTRLEFGTERPIKEIEEQKCPHRSLLAYAV